MDSKSNNYPKIVTKRDNKQEANGVDGLVRDVLIVDGKVVATLPDDVDVETVDASGCLVMPGGVDMHCHIAGPKVNVARKMRPEDKRTARPIPRTALTRSGTTCLRHYPSLPRAPYVCTPY